MSMYTKLTMKATTTMSLNERFTALRNLQPAPATDAASPSTSAILRAKTREQFQATLRNRRLAMQMASRPSVLAALKLKRKSLKQRLGQTAGMAGSGVKARLGIRGGRGGTWNTGLKSRLGITPSNNVGRPVFRRDVGLQQKSPSTSQVQGRGSFIQNNSRFRGGFRGRGRGGFRGGMQFRIQRGRGGARGRGAIAGATRGRGSRGGWNRNPPPSREALDNDLDQYMSRTKMTIS